MNLTDKTLLDNDQRRIMEIIAMRSVRWASSSSALMIVTLFIFLWAVAGPFLKFSPTWQVTLSLASSSVTFLMVFLLLGVQMKDSQAMQMKLNEIIAAVQGANNQLINIEDLSERAISDLHKRYARVATHLQDQDQTIASTEAIIAHEIAETQEAKE
jgi:low affinity Fe/Cu permease